MCFSAQASFTASAVLGVIGVATLRKVKEPSQIMFAVVPFLFAIQQFSEGFVWLGLTHQDWEAWARPSEYFFLVFAQLFWPLWMPLAILLLEKDPKQKKILTVLSVLGILTTVYLTYCLIFYPIQVDINGHHVKYQFTLPHSKYPWLGLFYFVPTGFPLFVSSIKKMRILAVVLLIAYVITKSYFAEHYISVWCFFAALMSIVVYYILTTLRTGTEK